MFYKPVNINITIFRACCERVKFVRHVMYANALRAATTAQFINKFGLEKRIERDSDREC